MNQTATGERVHWTSSGLVDDWQDEVPALIQTHMNRNNQPMLDTKTLRINLENHWGEEGLREIPAIISVYSDRAGVMLEFILTLNPNSFAGKSAVYNIDMEH